MNIVPATVGLTHQFYGKDIPYSSRGYFLLNDAGEPIATAGFVRRAKGVMAIYTQGKPEVFEHKKEIVKFGRFMLAIADMHGWELRSKADESILTAHGFAAHFGFEQLEGGEYVRWAR